MINSESNSPTKRAWITLTSVCALSLLFFFTTLPVAKVCAQTQDMIFEENAAAFEAWRKTIPDLERRQYERIKKINSRVLDNTRMIAAILIFQVVIFSLLILLLRRTEKNNGAKYYVARDGYVVSNEENNQLIDKIRSVHIRRPVQDQSRRIISKFKRFVKTASVIVVNVFLLFILVNAAFSLNGFHERSIFDEIDDSRDNWREYYDIEDLRRVYPDHSDKEILEFAVHPAGTGVTYEPYIQTQTESGLNGLVTEAAIHLDGFRLNGRSQAPWPMPENAFNVFVFGGSTTIGVGVRDDETIPAQLQHMLRKKLSADKIGKQINVYNFGSPGYFSLIERVWFETLLLDGIEPDYVIFIDGYNDNHVYAGDPGMTWWIKNHFPRWIASDSGEEVSWYFNQLLKSLPINVWLESLKKQDSLESFGTNFDGGGLTKEYLSDPNVLRSIIKRYMNNKMVTEAVAEIKGIQTLFVWQPVSTYKFDGVMPMGKMDGQGLRTKYGYPLLRNYFEEEKLGDNFLWCADVFEDVNQQNLWVDAGIHYNARGGEIIAKCIVERLTTDDTFLKALSDAD